MIGAKYAERISDYAAARFGDFIALPLPNGYRALHVAVMYKLKSDPEKDLLTEFRILTPSMYRLNELGVTGFRRREARYRNVSARWNLASNGRQDNRGLLDKKTKSLIEAFELDAPAEEGGSLYVFSPHGEVRILPSGSTALDFAYYIHSELANHTVKIEINGREVPFNCALRNGDLIRVRHDSHVPGPDISWLGCITTERARGNLRRGLTKRAAAIHRGRVLLQDALLKRLQHYRRHKNYGLTIAESLLNAFLWRTAQARGNADLNALYDDIKAGLLSPDKLVRWLISEEIGDAVVSDDSENRPAVRRLLFCSLCYPAPGDAIEGIEHARGDMTVHCRGECTATEGARVRVPLRWREETSDPAQEGEALYHLNANDRQGLLRDLLKLVYDEPKAYLLNVNADVHSNGEASISLRVKGDSWRNLVALQSKFSHVPDVKHVQSVPLAASQRFAVGTPAVLYRAPAYTLLEVHDYRFMDREEPVKELLSWLSVFPPNDWYVIHGQERVGKLARTLSPAPCYPAEPARYPARVRQLSHAGAAD
jgi:GTP pyrophosphokinase